MIKTIKMANDTLRPMGVAVAPDGAFVYVTTGRGRLVVIIDTKTNEVVGSIEVGQRPWGIAISPDGKTLYTANGPSNDVSIVDVAGPDRDRSRQAERESVGRRVRAVRRSDHERGDSARQRTASHHRHLGTRAGESRLLRGHPRHAAGEDDRSIRTTRARITSFMRTRRDIRDRTSRSFRGRTWRRRGSGTAWRSKSASKCRSGASTTGPRG